MDDRRTVASVDLKDHHRPTDQTKHFHGDRQLPTPASLRIVKFVDDPGYILLYLNAEGDEQTDTWHEDISQAMDQAAFEFGIKPEDWDIEDD